MGKIVVGCWDCDYCGADRISGDIKICPKCGKPRGKDVTFYMAGPKQYVEDPDKVSKNPDWLCSFCDTLNADTDKFCTSCGASREDSEMNYFEVKEKQRQEALRKEEENRKKLQNIAPQSSRSAGGRRLLPLLVIAAAVLVIAFMSMPRTKSMKVDAMKWERTVIVEKKQAVQESGWDLPAGAWDVTSRQEIYRYDQILDHYETREREVAEEVLDGYDVTYTYEDLGNGHFEEVEHREPRYRTEYHTEYYEEPVYISVPVYEEKYYYTIIKWFHDRDEVTSGTNSEPYFAELDLTQDEREGGRKEEYWIVSGDKTYGIDYELWEWITPGSSIDATVKSGRIISVE